jgi:hypothetical protein
MALDRGGHAAPDDRVLDPEQTQDLRHLRDVAEAVREVADAHRVAEVGCPCHPALEVPHDRLAADEELVDERLPRADREPSGPDVPAQPLLVLRADREVVVDGRELAVEREAVVRVGVQQLQHLVDDVDERHPERLERAVPLPVPVGVGDEEDQLLTEPASRPCTKYRCRAKKTASGSAISRKPPAASRFHSAP